MPDRETILAALQHVMDPELGMSIVDLGMIRDIILDGKTVGIRMVLTMPSCPLAGMITEQARQAVASLSGVERVTVTLLDEPWDPSWVKGQS